MDSMAAGLFLLLYSTKKSSWCRRRSLLWRDLSCSVREQLRKLLLWERIEYALQYVMPLIRGGVLREGHCLYCIPVLKSQSCPDLVRPRLWSHMLNNAFNSLSGHFATGFYCADWQTQVSKCNESSMRDRSTQDSLISSCMFMSWVLIIWPTYQDSLCAFPSCALEFMCASVKHTTLAHENWWAY